jgi:hypothetical protein
VQVSAKAVPHAPPPMTAICWKVIAALFRPAGARAL